jgi:sulfur carrier protein
MIQLRINGKQVEMERPTPLLAYLASLGVDQRAVAIELNERILERSELAEVVLGAGDVVEIVRMVGGGAGREWHTPRQAMADKPDKEKAAQDQVAEKRLLPGEDAASELPDDALHWASVYRELWDFKNRTIDRISIDAVGLGEVARQEVEKTDLVVLRAERNRFQRRAEFWRDRYRKLSKPAKS